jgi:polyhydroxybutyrate depolymerase
MAAATVRRTCTIAFDFSRIADGPQRAASRAMRAMTCLTVLGLLGCTGTLSGPASDGGAPLREDGGGPPRQDGGGPAQQDGGGPAQQDGGGSVRDDAGSTSLDRDGGTGTSNPERSVGCGMSTSRPSTFVVTDGPADNARSALVALPAGYDPNRAYPIVTAFHGGGGDGQGFRGYAGVEEVANGAAVFVYPNGIGGVWESEVYQGDFAYLRRMLDSLESELCIDSSREYAFGFSWGGWAATAIACSASSWIDGVASVAGGGPMGSCGSAVPTMLIHGRTDSAEGFSSSESTLSHVSTENGCSTSTTPFAPDPCTSLACTSPVVYCWHDGGHGIPGFGAQAMWNFFTSL